MVPVTLGLAHLGRVLRSTGLACMAVLAETAPEAHAQISDCREGDDFATAVVALGDVDGDCIEDFLVTDPHREQSFRDEGWVVAVSGATRRPIWSQFGGECHLSLGVHAWAVEDRDRDGVRDVECSARWYGGEHQFERWTLSGKDGRLLRRVLDLRLPPGRTAHEIAGRPARGQRLALESSAPRAGTHVVGIELVGVGDDPALLTLEDLHGVPLVVEEFPRRTDSSMCDYFVGVVGDVDGDCRNVVFVCAGTPFDAEYSMRSGEDLAPLWEVRQAVHEIYDYEWTTCGDLDGDGLRDLLCGAHWSCGGPDVYGYVEARSSSDGTVLFHVARADVDSTSVK